MQGVHCGVVPELVFCKPQVMSAVPLMTTCIVEGGHLPACNQDISHNIRGQPFDAYSISHPWPLKLLNAFCIFLVLLSEKDNITHDVIARNAQKMKDLQFDHLYQSTLLPT